MLKKQKTKEMGQKTTDAKGKRLVCIKETVAPGYGYWKTGDEITDPALVERFESNPHFEIQEEKS